jgi:hypothetical protein
MRTMKFSPQLLSPMLVCLAAQFLGGCSFSPLPIVQYRATAEGSGWDHGVELHPAKTERLDLRTGFLEYRREPIRDNSRQHPLYFRIEAANRSDTAVILDPVDFRIAIPGSDTMFSALDPEAITEGIREDMASEDARHGRELGAAVFESVASLSLDVLSLFAKETPEEKRDWQETKLDMRHRQSDREQRHSEAAERLSAREAFWADSVLRKTTLPPGGRLAGRIGFGVVSYGPTPDSLLLQYRERSGAFTDLTGYRIIRDSVETSRAKKPKPRNVPLSSYPGRF